LSLRQVSVCSGYEFVPPWLTSRHRQHFDQLISKAQPAKLKTSQHLNDFQ